jgi:MFS family permease
MNWWAGACPIPPPGRLRTLAWATLANTFGMGLWTAGSALFLTRSVGLSARSVGQGLTIAALIGLTASVPLGRLADRYDPRRLRAFLQFLQAAVAASYLTVHSFAGFVVVAVLDALLVCGNLAVRAALVAAVAGPQGRVHAFATLRAMANIGIGVGAALAGLALVGNTHTAYDLLVLGNAVTYLLSAVLVLRLPALPPGPARARGLPALPRRAVRDLRFLAASTASGVISLHSVVLTLIIPLWVVSRTAAPPAVVSAVLVTNTVLTVLLAVRMSHGVTTAIAAGRTVRLAGLTLAAAMSLYAVTANLSKGYTIALLVFATVLYTIGDLWHSVGAAGIAYSLAAPNAIGVYQGVDQLVTGSVRAAGPALLTGLILDGGVAGWAVTAAVFAVTGLLTPRLTAWASRDRGAGLLPANY